ncbi:MAG: DUF2283 domain-containing protein [Dehalococcoidia bacterium]|nr:DUF2283 domain-containing protein [Dehalococcoidia bacterium]
MRIQYFAETDTLHIWLAERQSVESEEIAPDVVADFDVDGNVVAFDIEHASKTIDLTSIETSALPLLATRATSVPAS